MAVSSAWLAGDVLLEMGRNRVLDTPLGTDLHERVRHRLAALLRAGSLSPVERAKAGNTLAQLGDPRFRADVWFLPDERMLGFVEIGAGEFLMGSDPEQDDAADDDEQPQHQVHLPRYFIARYPVTVAQFEAFVRESGYQPSDEDCLHGLPNHPVVSVSWYDALRYCAWLTERLREYPKTPRALLRMLQQGGCVTLPSEAEWEKAARGTEGLIYPWGDEPDTTKANYDGTGIDATSTVGAFPGGASPYGVEDMGGNVWEWTRSLWGEDWDKPTFTYPYEPGRERESLDASDDLCRVLRGGSFLGLPWSVRCACRGRDGPRGADSYVGFRVVVAVLP